MIRFMQIMLLSTHMKDYTNLFIYATKDLLESFNTNSKEYNIIKHYNSQYHKGPSINYQLCRSKSLVFHPVPNNLSSF